jgi:hypothetical protein
LNRSERGRVRLSHADAFFRHVRQMLRESTSTGQRICSV